ncbi:Zinc finger MYM-type protein 1 [Merluccius polli]|uniref:Zinc finger MYM-type protein 1 n=1 Tax=Merluccius polli TaxID=89951 RepID=A0AA47NVJ1_MERPO|nr:Zinc finger MYM-type protein 1 [Merluccius polli]
MALLEAERGRWRAVLTHLTAIVQSLAVQNLALRGHTETLFTPSNGNFLKEVELMARFDPIMKDHLNRVERGTASHNSYLGHHVQNELIDLLSSKIISAIVDNIKQARFFSIILDCTPDISHTEQLSVVIRVVSLKEKPHIKEHFMGFLEAEEASTCQHLASMILTRIMEHLRSWEFLLKTAEGSVDAMSYFGVLQKLYTLFSASTQRWVILKKHVSITLKMWTETRWESKVKSVEPMRYQGAAVREALIEVRDQTKDPAIKADAQSLSEEVGSYRFSICTVVRYDMLSAIQNVSKVMQSPNMDVDLAVSLLKKTERGLQSYRASGFVTAQMAAKDLCEEMNVEAVLKQKRLRSTKRHFSYESHDETITDALLLMQPCLELEEQCEALGTTLHFEGHSDLDSKELVQEIKNFPDPAIKKHEPP